MDDNFNNRNNNKFNMKTIKQWLKEGLSKEDYKKAKKYKSERWKLKEWNFEEALELAFIWELSEEGYDYWKKIITTMEALFKIK